MSNDVSGVEMHLSRYNTMLAVAIFGTTACGASGAGLGFLTALPLSLSIGFLGPAIGTGGSIGFVAGLMNCALVAAVRPEYRARVAIGGALLSGALVFGWYWRVAVSIGSV